MKEFFIYFYTSLLGGFGYCTIEIITRGRTHYSMFFAGAIVLPSFYFISKNINIPFFVKCLVGMLIITSIEFVMGIWFNVVMKEGVWDYSGVPLNFLGQICLPYSLLWLGLSAIAFGIIDKIPISG